MARGITETDVHTAADEIVAGGERPTVERIRAHLGTGSPNTVIRWLDTWWEGLARRLEMHQTSIAIPAAPDSVAVAAGRFWTIALEQAQAQAVEAIAADRAAVDAVRRGLDQERAALGTEATRLKRAAEQAEQAAQVAIARSAELERLVAQLEARNEELGRQRDAALGQAAQVEEARKAVEGRLAQVQEAARAEREGLAQHVRAVEDRAHAEIDRARQETKELRIGATAASKEQDTVIRSLREAADLATTKAAEAAQQVRVERARADALEVQMGKLQGLLGALEAAFKRQEAMATPNAVSNKARKRPGGSRASG